MSTYSRIMGAEVHMFLAPCKAHRGKEVPSSQLSDPSRHTKYGIAIPGVTAFILSCVCLACSMQPGFKQTFHLGFLHLSSTAIMFIRDEAKGHCLPSASTRLSWILGSSSLLAFRYHLGPMCFVLFSRGARHAFTREY